MNAREIATLYFFNKDFADAEIKELVWEFLDNHYAPDQLGAHYGYTPQDALEGQLDEYFYSEVSLFDPREG